MSGKAAFGAVLSFGTATGTATTATLANVTNISGFDGETAIIDVTSHDSGGAYREKVASFLDLGQVTVDFNYDAVQTTHRATSGGILWLRDQRLVAPWKAKAPATVYSAAGCLECRNTGFTGRQGIYEILRMDAPAQAALREHCDTDELRRIGMRGGMKTLRLSGARKIAAGLTTLEEVLRVAPSEQGRDGA